MAWKFRAWFRNRMLYNDFTITPDGKAVLNGRTGKLMASTNLRDCDGREIYEGDIVVDVERILDSGNAWGIVTMNPGKWISTMITGNPDAFCYGDFLDLVDKGRIRVVGNIYENPDTLMTLKRWIVRAPDRVTREESLPEIIRIINNPP